MYNNIAAFYDKLGWSQFSVKLWRQIKKNIIVGTYNPTTHLDLACGTGEVCLKAAQEGMKSEGLDISALMIQEARQKSEMANISIPYHLSDMRRFNTGKTYELITCLNDGINHMLTLNEWKYVFSSVREHLRQGGAFIFDCSTIKSYKDLWNGFHMERDSKGNYMIQKAFYSFEHRIATKTLTVFLKQGENQYSGFEETFTQTSFESSLVITMLREAGFYNNIITNLSFGELDDPDKEVKNIYICR